MESSIRFFEASVMKLFQEKLVGCTILHGDGTNHAAKKGGTILVSMLMALGTNRHFDENIVGLLFFHHFHLKIWLSWHLAQQGKVQVVIK